MRTYRGYDHLMTYTCKKMPVSSFKKRERETRDETERQSTTSIRNIYTIYLSKMTVSSFKFQEEREREREIERERDRMRTYRGVVKELLFHNPLVGSDDGRFL